MPTYIKTGYWRKYCQDCPGPKGYLNLDSLIESLAVPGPTGPEGPQGPVGPGGSINDLYYGSFIFDSVTALTSAIPNSSSTAAIQVTSTANFFSPGYMKIGDEVIGYTGTTPTSFTGITRGVASSSASSHSIGAQVSQAQYTAANVLAQVKLDETHLSNGVTLSGVGDINLVNAGLYNFQFSIQFENFGNDYDDVAVWFRVNGNPIAKTASYATIAQKHSGAPGAIIMTINYFHPCNPGDIISLMWANDQGTAAITSIPPTGSIPQSPGVIFTVNRVGA